MTASRMATELGMIHSEKRWLRYDMTRSGLRYIRTAKKLYRRGLRRTERAAIEQDLEISQ